MFVSRVVNNYATQYVSVSALTVHLVVDSYVALMGCCPARVALHSQRYKAERC